MKQTKLTSLFQKAKNDSSLAVIEGVQALKHAVRFEAEIEKVITCDINMLQGLLHELAPDISHKVLEVVEEVSEEVFERLSPRPIRTKTIALAKRRTYSLNDLPCDRPIVLLENPKDLDNVGAVVRVASAANAAAVITVGDIDIWHPLAIRGGAGLQYATAVFSLTDLDLQTLKRPLIAMDPTGETIQTQTLPKNAVFIFGTERHGITQKTLNQAEHVISLPMKPGVSSMNLATSVSATLYSSSV